MPFIKIAGLPEKFLCDISEDLIDIVNKETDTPKKRIRIFYNPMKEIVEKNFVEDRVIIDIDWMPRPMEMREKVSKAFFDYLENRGYKKIRIYFTDINKDYYFVK